jgi:hypothetical protein
MCLCPALRPRRDRGLRPYEADGTAPVMSRARAPTMEFSRLNHTALALAVYASWDGSLHHHARLASGCGPRFTRRDWLPAGSQRKVSARASPFPRLRLAQGQPGFPWLSSAETWVTGDEGTWVTLFLGIALSGKEECYALGGSSRVRNPPGLRALASSQLCRCSPTCTSSLAGIASPWRGGGRN